MADTFADQGYTFVRYVRPTQRHITEIRAMFEKRAIVGIIILEEGRLEKVLNLAYLKVFKDHRHKGLATELHRLALELATEKGLHLRSVNPLNKKLTPLWDKLKDNRRVAEGGDIKTGAGSEL